MSALVQALDASLMRANANAKQKKKKKKIESKIFFPFFSVPDDHVLLQNVDSH